MSCVDELPIFLVLGTCRPWERDGVRRARPGNRVL